MVNQEGIIKSLNGFTFIFNDDDWYIWSKTLLISDDVKCYREILNVEVEIPTKYEEDKIKHEIIINNKFLSIKYAVTIDIAQVYIQILKIINIDTKILPIELKG